MSDIDINALLPKLRAAGWSVAVHNDYRLGGVPHTFWLFTHPNGRWIKGEGKTDAEALSQAADAVAQLAAAPKGPRAIVKGVLEAFERMASGLVGDAYARGYREAIAHVEDALSSAGYDHISGD